MRQLSIVTARGIEPDMPWVKSNIPPKNTLSASAKAEIVSRAERFVQDNLRVETPPRNHRYNYVIGYTVKWHGAYLIFTARYASPSPKAVSPEFDRSFAGFGCFARDRFNLWARRHNDEWLILDEGLTLDAALKRLVEDPWFQT